MNRPSIAFSNWFNVTFSTVNLQCIYPTSQPSMAIMTPKYRLASYLCSEVSEKGQRLRSKVQYVLQEQSVLDS